MGGGGQEDWRVQIYPFGDKAPMLEKDDSPGDEKQAGALGGWGRWQNSNGLGSPHSHTTTTTNNNTKTELLWVPSVLVWNEASKFS